MAISDGQPARVVELPEFISVETKVVKATQCPKDSGLTFLHDKPTQPTTDLRQSNSIVENITNFVTPTLISNIIPYNKLTSLITTASAAVTTTTTTTQMKIDTGCQVKPELKDIGVNTLNSSVECNKCLEKSKKSNQVSSATQCALSDESDEECMDLILENHELVVPDFQDFVKKQCQSYAHGIYECTLCGEISKEIEELNSHMLIHWGPNVLCFKCGRLLESSIMHTRHRCKKNRRSRNLLCSHAMCPIIKISLKHKRRCCIRDPYDRLKNKRIIKKRFDCKGIKSLSIINTKKKT